MPRRVRWKEKRIMRIHALGSYYLNPGDLDWSPVERLGEFREHPYFYEEVERGVARNAEALLVDSVPFPAERFSCYPELKYLGLFATGHDSVDLDAAKDAGVAVTHVPAYSTSSVAEMTLALLLNLAHRIGDYEKAVRNGLWREGRRFQYLPIPLIELEEKALAILGFGEIGRAVAQRAHAFGMRILGNETRRRDDIEVPVDWLPWDSLLAQADAITLHLPLNEETRGIIDAGSIGRMKRGCILINTARGGLVDDRALADALEEGTVGAAGLDVIGAQEPPRRDNPLLTAPNCVITPHIAWATRASRERCLREAAANLEAFIRGGERNRLV